jgi:hypothetical protein
VTLIEFLHPLKGGARKGRGARHPLLRQAVQDQPAMTATEIKAAMRQARIPKAKDMNVDAVVN